MEIGRLNSNNKKIYSVSDVNGYLKRVIDGDVFLDNISIKGEVSNYKDHYSGHIYFSIKESINGKDVKSVLPCVMFRSYRGNIDKPFKDGDKVVCTGKIAVYERDGKYQLYVKRVEAEGKGDLHKEFLLLKNRLEEMGMFSDIYKKPIPKYAKCIGVCTASTGAVINDIRNVAFRRNPYVKIVLYPCKVQGDGAADSVIKGIEYLNTMDEVDTIIIGRGGGSIEDLWCFNEEKLAGAIFASEKPVISAVGHEVDFTIADFVADMRAPTPSAAAELAVFDYNEFENNILKLNRDLNTAITSKINMNKRKVAELEKRLEKSIA